MKCTGQSDYTKICICYRVFSVMLAAAVYIIFAIQADELSFKKMLVTAGMLLACFLYNYIVNQDIKVVWIYIMVTIEVLAYGIFIFLSGGFYSPFLWPCIGGLLLPMSLKRPMPMILPAAVWYLLCTIANYAVRPPELAPANLEINTGIGVITVLSGFYILTIYIRRLNENQNVTEQALNHITDLYDSFHLFTMSDIDKTMEKLMDILKRTVLPDGGLLIKYNEAGEPEGRLSVGMDQDLLHSIKDWIINQADNKPRSQLTIKDREYDVLQIGNSPVYSGLLIRPQQEMPVIDAKRDRFYYSLVDMVFQNMDMHKQLEEYLILEEQKRIADEIHDTVIQKLFGIACKLKVWETTLVLSEPHELESEFSGLRQSVELVMRELREAIYGKRFDGYSRKFHERLDVYMKEIEKLWDVRIFMSIDKNIEILSASHKLAIYKTVCEAANNAVRHGRATSVTVEIRIEDEDVCTVISDDGAGFSAEDRTAEIREGNGLKNMQRLAWAFKGRCVIEPGGDAGVQVKLYLPR